MVEPNRAEVRDRLIPRDHRRLVDPVGERRWGPAEQVWRRWIKDPDHVVGRCCHVGIEVIADMTELGGGEIVDVIRRSQETQFLTAEPDETQLVQRVDVLHHLSDIQDRRGTRRVVQHSDAVNRVQVLVDSAVPFWTACWYSLSRLLPMSKDVKASFVTGRIALIQRDTCNFGVKVLNAEAAGATGVNRLQRGQPRPLRRTGRQLGGRRGEPDCPDDSRRAVLTTNAVAATSDVVASDQSLQSLTRSRGGAVAGYQANLRCL